MRWTVATLSTEQEQEAQEIAQSLGLSLVTSRLLLRRGISNIEEAKQFLNPQLKNQHDPYLMKDMDRAISTLRYHLHSRRPIMITGDHDVDGVTSVSLVHNVLRDLFGCKDRLHYHIPNKDDEGYGISRNCIDWAKALGCELIIATDTGIKAVEAVAYARREGLDVIICDHHQADSTLPQATAILNPKQEGCLYPNKHLSGCGVSYKLMQALAEAESIEPSKLYPYLDLLGISTAADLVPLIGENRIYLVHGLHQLNSHPSIGLKALLELVGLDDGERIDISSIIYKIAPRLNAAGRMQDGQIAVDLLTASSPDYARKVCKKLEEYNEQRRSLDQRMTEEAESLVQAHLQESEELPPILMLYLPHWHIGVMGIVAARMMERYQRPTFVMTRQGGDIIASGRSARPLNIYTAIESCRELVKNFGGHKYAAGLTTQEEHIPLLQERLARHITEQKSRRDEDEGILVDAQLGIDEITSELVQELRLLAPFGLGNERPLFVTERMRDAGGSKLVGREGRHLKLRMTDRYCKTRPIHGIALGQAQHARWVLSQQAFGICYSFDESNKQSNLLSLQIKEIFTN